MTYEEFVERAAEHITSGGDISDDGMEHLNITMSYVSRGIDIERLKCLGEAFGNIPTRVNIEIEML